MKKRKFEGWYFKHVKNDQVLAVIPGMHRDQSGNEKVFIQVITNDNSFYLPFHHSEFYSDPKKMYVRIGDNEFTERGIKLSIQRSHIKLEGNIRYGNKDRIAYDIMGPFKYLPCMECRHGIISMEHGLFGHMTYNGNYMEFTGGTGYIEKDQGTSFPKEYLWSQCNTFPGKKLSIMAAAARIPYGAVQFFGTICAIKYKGKEYRLTSYLGARVILAAPERLVIAQKNMRLEVHLLKSNGKLLYAPVKGQMKRTIHEDLNCTVSYKFYINGKLVLQAKSGTASYEYDNY